MKNLLKNKIVLWSLIGFLTLGIGIGVFFTVTSCESTDYDYQYTDEARMEIVKTYLDNVLNNCRSDTNITPLLADGINTFNGDLASWANPDGSYSAISNFASQQNFMRTLVAYSILANDSFYKQQAMDTTSYFLQNYVHDNGLFQWGGHTFIDIDTGKVMGTESKGLQHELKNHYPYYDLLIEVNEEAVTKYLLQTWAAHVVDWTTLDINRHGSYTTELNVHGLVNNSNSILLRALPADNVVDVTKTELTPQNTTALILPEGKGLTFINAGSDLYYNAYLLSSLTDDITKSENAESWGKFLATQYNLAKNPVTGLPVYQFSQPKATDTTDDDSNTKSSFGDRAGRQLADPFGAIALEGNVLFKNIAPIMIDSINMNLYISDSFGDSDLANWAIDTLKAYYKYAITYNALGNMKFLPMWNDGTSVLNFSLLRDGYYGKQGNTLGYVNPSSEYLLPVARAFNLTDSDEELWNILRTLTKGLGYGDIGKMNGEEMDLSDNPSNPETEEVLANSYGLMTFIELYDATNRIEYLNMARKIADNIINIKYHRGYFVKSAEYVYCRINDNDCLSLLMLEAAIKGKLSEMPVYLADTGYVHGSYFDYTSSYAEYYYKHLDEMNKYTEMSTDYTNLVNGVLKSSDYSTKYSYYLNLSKTLGISTDLKNALETITNDFDGLVNGNALDSTGFITKANSLTTKAETAKTETAKYAALATSDDGYDTKYIYTVTDIYYDQK